MNVKNLVLGIGIFIVFMFLLHNGIRAFYPGPEYENYCKTSMYPTYPTVVSPNCTYPREIREQEQQCYNDKGQPMYEYNEAGCTIAVKECNYCQRDFDAANKDYNKVVFIIAIIIGIITLLVGYAILTIEPVGSALMASGIGAIIYGTIRNWDNLGSIGRFILLLLAFLLLIWITVRLNTLAHADGKKRRFFSRKK